MAKYDYGGGCACGLSRFCDCSYATAQDHFDREEYDKNRKKEKPVALKQTEDLYVHGLHSVREATVQLEIVNKGTLKVKTVANGLEIGMNIPMPAELSKAIERVLRAGCGQ